MINKVGSRYELTTPTGSRVIGYFKTRVDAIEHNHNLMLFQIQREKALEKQYRVFGYKHSIWSTK